MLNIAICDDNLTYLNATMMIVSNYFEKKKEQIQLFPFSKANELTNWIDSFGDTLHILILDICLDKNKNGIPIAKRITDNYSNTQIVFTTAYIENAADICEAKFSYFVYKKKNWFVKLQKALDKATSTLDDISSHQLLIDKQIISTTSVEYIESDKKQSIIDLIDGDSITVNKGIHYFAEALPSNFYQIHRCSIINMDCIDSLDKAKKEVILHNGKTLSVSRSRYSDFSDTYYNYLAGKLFQNK